MQERWKREAGEGGEREVEVEVEQEVSGCVRNPRTVKSGSIDGVYLSWGKKFGAAAGCQSGADG